MKHKHFLLHQGYAEDQSVACVPLTHDEGFETPEEGLEAFYRFLLGQAALRIPKPKDCCHKTFSEHEEAAFCMTCGHQKVLDNTPEDLVPVVWGDIWGGDLNSLGIKFWKAMQEEGWSWDLPTGPFVLVYRTARFFSRWDGDPDADAIIDMSYFPTPE